MAPARVDHPESEVVDETVDAESGSSAPARDSNRDSADSAGSASSLQPPSGDGSEKDSGKRLSITIPGGFNQSEGVV